MLRLPQYAAVGLFPNLSMLGPTYGHVVPPGAYSGVASLEDGEPLYEAWYCVLETPAGADQPARAASTGVVAVGTRMYAYTCYPLDLDREA